MCGNLANIIDIEIRDELNQWHLTNWKLCKINNCPPTVRRLNEPHYMWGYKQRVKKQKESLLWWYALPHLSVQCADSALSPGFKALQDQCRTSPKWGAPSAFYHPVRDLSSWALCQAQLLRGLSFSDEHRMRTHTACALSVCLILYQYVFGKLDIWSWSISAYLLTCLKPSTG